MNANFAVYTSHDASIAVRCDDGAYRVAELERLAGHRYFSLDNPPPDHDWLATFERGLDAARAWQPALSQAFLAIQPSVVVTNQEWSPVRESAPVSLCGHHDAHAACAFYQSPFERATIVSYDGGGPDADGRTQFFCVYEGDKRDGTLERVAAYDLNLGTAYLSHASFVDDIRRTTPGVPGADMRWLSWAGKLMALAAFGRVDHDALDAMLHGGHAESIFHERFTRRQFDWCATVQAFHVAKFEQTALPHLPPGTPVCVTGGCALNIGANQRLRDAGFDVFVPPNPNDCGLALGCLLWQDRPRDQVQCAFNGLPFDGDVSSYPRVSHADVSAMLRGGRILGFIEGDSELGPRALGHRSILCRGSLPYARARLNAIKGREWYRPVSPVFFGADSPFMSFAKRSLGGGEWVHADGTMRHQSVALNSDLGRFIYDLGVPGEPLLNTSLNLRGRPLVNNLADALSILRDTALDALVINGHLIEKHP